MTELLLHHYDGSPFSEKIRVLLGIKGLSWGSVLQPDVMPKPQLVPLTGGYRRIPVLQIGADVYCDSQLIARVLEEVRPSPTLFPAASHGLCHALQFWADRLLFQAAMPVLFARLESALPKELVEDRRKLMGERLDFAAMVRAAPFYSDQLRAHADLIEAQLRDARPFLLGERPSLADAAAYHPVWFLRSMAATAHAFYEFPRLSEWAERVKDLGHGERSECLPAEALRIARETQPATDVHADARDPSGLRPGERVEVVPDDYGFDPVAGELVASSAQEIALRRDDAELGAVVVHFPRAGFRVTRA